MSLPAAQSSPIQSRGLVLLAALVSVIITSSLGLWQLSRASQKEAIAANIVLRQAQPALSNAALLATANNAADVMTQTHYRAARITGRWLNQHTVFLDNRQMQGHVGFFVLTPFQLADNGSVLLVQRGWVPRQFNDRNALPNVTAPDAEQTVDVMMTPPPARLYQFKGEDSGKLRQNIEMTAFAREKNLALLPFAAQQMNHASLNDGLLRDWPRVNTGVEKHYGYAFQWFGLAALIVLLTVWFQFIKPRRVQAT
jgi:surfeit locus 1 family protein